MTTQNLVTVKIPVELYRRLEQIKERTDVPIAVQVRRAVLMYTIKHSTIK